MTYFNSILYHIILINIAKVLLQFYIHIHFLYKILLKMYNVQFMIYIVYRFSQNVQECTILLNFQIHCVQNVHSSHPESMFAYSIYYKSARNIIFQFFKAYLLISPRKAYLTILLLMQSTSSMYIQREKDCYSMNLSILNISSYSDLNLF